ERERGALPLLGGHVSPHACGGQVLRHHCYSMHMRSNRARLVSSVAIVVLSVVALVAQTPGVHPISGRRIAPVMGYQGAEWLERPERVDEEAPDSALDALKIRPGDSVADI